MQIKRAMPECRIGCGERKLRNLPQGLVAKVSSGHILVPKVSQKFYNLLKKAVLKTKEKRKGTVFCSPIRLVAF